MNLPESVSMSFCHFVCVCFVFCFFPFVDSSDCQFPLPLFLSCTIWFIDALHFHAYIIRFSAVYQRVIIALHAVCIADSICFGFSGLFHPPSPPYSLPARNTVLHLNFFFNHFFLSAFASSPFTNYNYSKCDLISCTSCFSMSFLCWLLFLYRLVFCVCSVCCCCYYCCICFIALLSVWLFIIAYTVLDCLLQQHQQFMARPL